jgi:hypothetical protein
MLVLGGIPEDGTENRPRMFDEAFGLLITSR